jgi:Tfp pilus assembly protein PilO
MAIQKVEKQRKLGVFVMQNLDKLQAELVEVDEALAFDGEEMEKSLPVLNEFKGLLSEPEVAGGTAEG